MKRFKLLILLIILISINNVFSAPLTSENFYADGITTFRANLVNNSQVLLSWNSVTGITNNSFEIERQDANGVWQKIGYVNSGSEDRANSNYQFTDAAPWKGNNYYRLKYISTDGSIGYTDNVLVEYRKTMLGLSFQNYPNPFTSTTTIRYEVLRRGTVRIAVFDLQGTEVQLLANRIDEPGIHTIDWNGFKNQPGTYIYKIITEDDNITQTMVKH